ncbi:MAG TPA: hypothetical protein PKG71_01065 [Candidatus Woesebacteria bacterium]|nr:hypothetical protein [Candidatus Woesebacteria bacterium]HNS94536.1 hypothetical protein [Candidatus Woesebacteria bacterium]
MNNVIVEFCRGSATGFTDEPPAIYANRNGGLICVSETSAGRHELPPPCNGVTQCNAIYCRKKIGGNQRFSRLARVKGA